MNAAASQFLFFLLVSSGLKLIKWCCLHYRVSLLTLVSLVYKVLHRFVSKVSLNPVYLSVYLSTCQLSQEGCPGLSVLSLLLHEMLKVECSNDDRNGSVLVVRKEPEASVSGVCIEQNSSHDTQEERPANTLEPWLNFGPIVERSSICVTYDSKFFVIVKATMESHTTTVTQAQA